MLHCLYKLEFSTPVHFGAGDYTHSVESCRMCFAADTFFSALCSIAVKSGEIDKLVRLVLDKKLRFSDSFPYHGDELWLPKPILSPKAEHTGNPSDKKIMKNSRIFRRAVIPIMLIHSAEEAVLHLIPLSMISVSSKLPQKLQLVQMKQLRIQSRHSVFMMTAEYG